MRVTEFRGEGEVVGESVAVEMVPRGEGPGCTLSLHGLTPEGAWAVLGMLHMVPGAPRAAASFPLPGILDPVQAPPPPSPQPRLDPAAIEAFARAVPVKEPKEPKAAKPKEPKAAKEPKAEEPGPKPAPVFDPATSVAEDPLPPPPPPAAPAEVGAIPDAVLAAKKLRDVMTHYVLQGLNLDAIIAEMRRIQDAVPLLARLEDLEGRARRTWEVIDLEGM